MEAKKWCAKKRKTAGKEYKREEKMQKRGKPAKVGSQ